MKALNNIKFVSEVGKQIENLGKQIGDAGDYKKAQKIGNMALGNIDCMITYLNCMIDSENNDFTEELDELIDSWTASIYQQMAEKAIATGQSADVVMKNLKKRDEHRR